METVIAEMLLDEGVRMAGARRIALETKALQAGLSIPDALKSQLDQLVG
jgi:(2R)-3-sulfolactate dehydrogenase (NADP+)